MWRILAPLAAGWLVWALGVLTLPRNGPYSLAVFVMFSTIVCLFTLGAMVRLLGPFVLD
jgi:hypothetical protein